MDRLDTRKEPGNSTLRPLVAPPPAPLTAPVRGASALQHAQAHNFLKLLAQSAAVSQAYTSAVQALASGCLSTQQRERIALAVSEIHDCRYSLAAHTALGRLAGMSDDDIWFARQAGANAPKDEALLRFTQAVALQRGRVRSTDIAELRRAGFSDTEFVEIIANIALNVFSNYLNLVFKTEIDFPLLHPETQPARG